MTKHVILVTGASSGFGLMTARALAQACHIVYASMRETQGRNAPQVAEVADWAARQQADLRTIELDTSPDDVGAKFPQVARAIHLGDEPERAIRGRASLAEAKSLLEDGVGVLPLPMLEDELN